jgi:hypothetical protein
MTREKIELLQEGLQLAVGHLGKLPVIGLNAA